jgi:hypothetical protein
MRTRTVSAFCLKATLLALPAVLTVAAYVGCDPFFVIWRHPTGNYYDAAAPVELNHDWASVNLLTENEPTQHFDSFIIGSSQSNAFHCDALKKHLPDAHPFHYLAASENLYGIAAKLEYLDTHGFPLRNVLLEIWRSTIKNDGPRHDLTHRLPYPLNGESWFGWQATNLSDFFTGFYFAKYIGYRVAGRVPAYATDVLAIRVGDHRVDPVTNDYFYDRLERELAEDPVAFYANRSAMFPPHDASVPPCDPPYVKDRGRAELARIRAVLQRHRTKIRVVIPPVYDRVCMHVDDVRELSRAFGETNVFDFTGPNELTEDMHNFYDDGHVRPFVAEKILGIVYADPRGVSRRDQ